MRSCMWPARPTLTASNSPLRTHARTLAGATHKYRATSRTLRARLRSVSAGTRHLQRGLAVCGDPSPGRWWLFVSLGLGPDFNDQLDAFGLELAATPHLQQISVGQQFDHGATPDEKSVRAFPAFTLSEITLALFFWRANRQARSRCSGCDGRFARHR